MRAKIELGGWVQGRLESARGEVRTFVGWSPFVGAVGQSLGSGLGSERAPLENYVGDYELVDHRILDFWDFGYLQLAAGVGERSSPNHWSLDECLFVSDRQRSLEIVFLENPNWRLKGVQTPTEFQVEILGLHERPAGKVAGYWDSLLGFQFDIQGVVLETRGNWFSLVPLHCLVESVGTFLHRSTSLLLEEGLWGLSDALFFDENTPKLAAERLVPPRTGLFHQFLEFRFIVFGLRRSPHLPFQRLL
jgi:hypothetical protein